MPHKDFLPGADIAVLGFARNFSATISADPAVYAIAPAHAAELAELTADYAAAFARTSDPATRTRPAIAAKTDARRALERKIRWTAKWIQCQPQIPPEQRLALGLKVRGRRHRIAAPGSAPLLSIVGIRHGSHILRLADSDSPSSRARPAGVRGAQIFRFVGPTHPPDIRNWSLADLATTTRVELPCTVSEAGQQIHLRARWYTATGKPGPLSAPITIRAAA